MENSSTPTVTLGSVSLRYGLITGIISLLLSAVMYMTGTDQSPLRFLAYPIMIAGIWMAHRDFKLGNAGFMSFGQGVKIGLIVSAIIGVLSCLFVFVYASFIDTNFLTRLVETERAKMEAKPGMTDEQIDQAMSIAEKFMTLPVIMFFALLITIIVGLVFSLIISAITKHSRPEFE